MNKLKYTLGALLIAVSSNANADFLGVYAGAEKWNFDLDGSLSSLGSDIDINRDLGLKDDSANVYYVAFEHPIPFLPNLMLQKTSLEGNSTGTATQDFSFQSGNYVTGQSLLTNYDLSHTDYTLYYEILDNWVNLDLGLSARDFDGFVDVRPNSTTVPGVNTRVDISGTVPMLYGKAQFDLPFTGLSAGGKVNLGQFNDDKISDIKAYVAYEGESGFGVEAGYRIFELEFDDFDQLNSDLTLDGFYAAITFHF